MGGAAWEAEWWRRAAPRAHALPASPLPPRCGKCIEGQGGSGLGGTPVGKFYAAINK